MEATFGLAAIVFGAVVVEASLGFGATVITVALGSLLFPIATLLPAFVPVNMGLSACVALYQRKAIDRRLLLRWVAPWMSLGLPLGLLLFRFGDNRALTSVFGSFVIVLSLVELWRHSHPGPEEEISAGKAKGLLVLAGVAHGAFAAGGPLAVYVAGRQLSDKRAFRSTLAALWLIMNGVLCTGYALGAQFTRQTAGLSVACTISLVGGIAVGEWLHRRVKPSQFSPLVFSLLLVVGALLVVKT